MNTVNIVEKKMLVVYQDEKWWASTDKKLEKIVSRYVALVNHENWQVRQTLVYCASALLQNCYKLVRYLSLRTLVFQFITLFNLNIENNDIFKVSKCSILRCFVVTLKAILILTLYSRSLSETVGPLLQIVVTLTLDDYSIVAKTAHMTKVP